jgi:ABC-type maltose transport system permease subunit
LQEEGDYCIIPHFKSNMHELIDLIDLIYEKINYIIYTLLYRDAHVYHMHSNTGEIDQIPKQFQLAADVDQVTQVKQILLLYLTFG